MMLAVGAVTLPLAIGEQVRCKAKKVFRRIHFSSEDVCKLTISFSKNSTSKLKNYLKVLPIDDKPLRNM